MVERAKNKESLDLGERIIVFIGPEGSGKTTIAKSLAQESGKPYITTRGILEDLADNDPGPWGQACREMFEKRTYLDGETLLEILIDRFSKDDVAEGFILDGGLRTVEETVGFPEMLKEAGCFLPLDVIYLQIPEDTTYERLVWGKNARRRNDDTPDGVAKRLDKFNYRLDERISFIKDEERWRIFEIDATPSIGQVYQEVLRLAS
jgi:adenylate kinase